MFPINVKYGSTFYAAVIRGPLDPFISGLTLNEYHFFTHLVVPLRIDKKKHCPVNSPTVDHGKEKSRANLNHKMSLESR